MIDFELFKNIMSEARSNPDLLDSYSPNQFKSKDLLIKHIESLNILTSESDITIFGSWYGSILIPAFKRVKRITAIDIDDKVIRIAKQRLFKHYTNADFITADVFCLGKHSERCKQSNLIINTSCEHMSPMKELKILTESKSYFAFQSNNMFNIPTHINCVNNIKEFKKQLPNNAKVLIEDSIEDSRGIRFMLIGKL